MSLARTPIVIEVKVRAIHPAIGELSFVVRREPLVIGRRGGGDLDIPWDVLISRRHARLWEESGEVWFEDLGSRNGSYAGNDKLKGPVRFAPGLKIVIGDTILTLGDPTPTQEFAEITEERFAQPRASLEPRSYAGLPIPEPAQGEDKQTVDLRAPAAAARVEPAQPIKKPEPPKAVPPIARQHPRFAANGRVEVLLRERETLRTLWVQDISKGGLFVMTDTPPPRGTKLQVELGTPHGKLMLHAEVVHIVDRDTAQRVGCPAGVGLAFSDLTPDVKKAIQLYVDGLANRLDAVPPAQLSNAQGHAAANAHPANAHAHAANHHAAAQPAPQPHAHPQSQQAKQKSGKAAAKGKNEPPPPDPKLEIEKILELARRVLADFERNDLYALLDVEATDPPERIHIHALSLQRALEILPPGMSAAQVARIETARRCVERVTSLFHEPIRRLEYDFRTGQVRADERLAESKRKGGISVVKLRDTWNRVYPGSCQYANQLSHIAFEARRRRDFASAIEAGKEALKHDPFLEELKNSVAAWEAMIERI